MNDGDNHSPPPRTILEHLREIHRLEVSDPIPLSASAPQNSNGLVFPAPWIKREFPELAEEKLDALSEYCLEMYQESKRR